VVAGDAETAVRLAAADPPDVAFVDIRMPGVDGLAAAGMLAACTAGRTRLVATSASAMLHERSGYAAAGFHEFLPKPIDLAELAAALARVPGVRLAAAAPDEGAALVVADPDLSVRVPTALRLRIRRAALRCSATDLRQCLADAERVAPDAADVAVLKRALRSYDMDAVAAAFDDGTAEHAVGYAS
jgi:CheY-like chemotaxis protein